MTLPELYEQQRKDLENYNLMRDRVWQDLQKEQQEITEAFGSRENLPEDLNKRFAQQINGYHEEWALNDGQRHKEMIHQHEQQRLAASGYSAPAQAPPDHNAKQHPDQLSDRQAELQKIIKQQQAIKARNLQKKRGR